MFLAGIIMHLTKVNLHFQQQTVLFQAWKGYVFKLNVYSFKLQLLAILDT